MATILHQAIRELCFVCGCRHKGTVYDVVYRDLFCLHNAYRIEKAVDVVFYHWVTQLSQLIT